MNKREAIACINKHIGHEELGQHNANYSNTRYKRKQVWWFSIQPEKFNQDLHLILIKEKASDVVWMEIPANTFPYPRKSFRVKRNDTRVSFELDRNQGNSYMHCTLSDGTVYDFSKHIKHEFG